jgi:large subunit ribosomal protein L35
VTASGKIMRTKGMKSHNRRKKAPRTKRQFDRMIEVDSTNRQHIERMLPYGA